MVWWHTPLKPTQAKTGGFLWVPSQPKAHTENLSSNPNKTENTIYSYVARLPSKLLPTNTQLSFYYVLIVYVAIVRQSFQFFTDLPPVSDLPAFFLAITLLARSREKCVAQSRAPEVDSCPAMLPLLWDLRWTTAPFWACFLNKLGLLFFPYLQWITSELGTSELEFWPEGGEELRFRLPRNLKFSR